MTLLAQSFLLSFSTLWRYLIVMPFVVIPSIIVLFSVLVVPLLLSQWILFLAALFAPILFFLVALVTLVIVTFLIISVFSFNIMIGCRAAFGALGSSNDLDFGRLVGKSLSFSLVQMVASVFMVLFLGGIIAATFLMSAEGTAFLNNPPGNLHYLETFLSTHPVAIGVGILATALSLALSAVLSVPMAGAAISATPKMGPTDAFIGIGAAFVPMMFLLIIIAIATAVSGAQIQLISLFSSLAVAAVQFLTESTIVWPERNDLAIGLAMFVFVLWTSCWFYSASALGWKRFSDDRAAALAYKADYDRFEPDDLRALREKRDRERNGS